MLVVGPPVATVKIFKLSLILSLSLYHSLSITHSLSPSLCLPSSLFFSLITLPLSPYPSSSLQIKLDSVSAESYVTIGTLQVEKTELLRLKEAMSKYVREIEQHNDNLERGNCNYILWRKRVSDRERVIEREGENERKLKYFNSCNRWSYN